MGHLKVCTGVITGIFTSLHGMLGDSGYCDYVAGHDMAHGVQIPAEDIDNVIEYAVTLVSKTRPNNPLAPEFVKSYLDWGAGPRASQNLILAAKTNAVINGKYSPDIEDVQAVAFGILRHRIVKNYKADAEGISEEVIIKKLF